MDDCIFCKIVARELPAEIVYEDENTLAFLDIQPVNKGHTLVIPKKHTVNIFDIDKETMSAIYEAARIVSKAVKKGTGADGINLNNNNGAAAGQEVFHYHAHIIPRFANDELSHWHKKEYKEGEMTEFTKKIRANLDSS